MRTQGLFRLVPGLAAVLLWMAGHPEVQAAAQQPIDPFPNPLLAPTTTDPASTNGARFGCSRKVGTEQKWHGGTDLAAPVGTTFKAVYAGVVSAIRNDVSNTNASPGVGNFVIVKSDDLGVSLKYCHLSEVSVKAGDKVAQGAVLGKTGRSGNAFNVPKPHLHVEVSTDHFATNTKYTDPEPFLKTKYGPNPNPPTCPGTPAAGPDPTE